MVTIINITKKQSIKVKKDWIGYFIVSLHWGFDELKFKDEEYRFGRCRYVGETWIEAKTRIINKIKHKEKKCSMKKN